MPLELSGCEECPLTHDATKFLCKKRRKKRIKEKFEQFVLSLLSG
jgi:hypothetical protein